MESTQKPPNSVGVVYRSDIMRNTNFGVQILYWDSSVQLSITGIKLHVLLHHSTSYIYIKKKGNKKKKAVTW